MVHKSINQIVKRAISICIILIALLYSFLCSCASNQNQTIERVDGFSVTFIDVGNGDSIFINFGDGKCMLIDSGLGSEFNFDNICKVLDAYQVSTINYLVITHPDVDHIGNTYKLLTKYSVDMTFLPKIENKSLYPDFNLVYNKLLELGVKINYSNFYHYIEGSNYFLAFLSPCYAGVGDYYEYFNSIAKPSERDINNLSPIIYLEYRGVRFLFTGDAEKAQEKLLLDNYKVDLYDLINKREINLYDIDLLKVSHHGSDDSNSYEFLSLLKPKFAVISVGGDNVYGHPSADVLSNLKEVNPKVQILRTDVLGSITVKVDDKGKLEVKNKVA